MLTTARAILARACLLILAVTVALARASAQTSPDPSDKAKPSPVDHKADVNEAHMVDTVQGQPKTPASPAVPEKRTARSIHLVIDDALLERVRADIPQSFRTVTKSKLDSRAILDAVSAGDSLVWIGDGKGIPPEMWVQTFRPGGSKLTATLADASPVALGAAPFRASRLRSAFIAPCKPDRMPMHNVDEYIRADFLPILEARDRFGGVVGYPGVLVGYYAPSLTGRRFEGSECFFFLFDEPVEALSGEGWVALLKAIASRFQSGLQLRRVETDYALYRVGERLHVRARVANLRTAAASVEIRFSIKPSDEEKFGRLVSHRRCPDAGDESEAVCDFLVNGKPGLWTIRVDACQDPKHAEELALEGNPVPVDRRDIGVVVLEGQLQTPAILRVKGPSIQLEGQDGFWIGTEYSPSSSFWEWLWRDFRPLEAAKHLAEMRRAGYRIARFWVDPVLDEQSMRAMDAAIWLASRNGIVAEPCLFNQCVRTIGFERPNGERVSFDFRARREFNQYGISLRHMGLQKEYAQTAARRWQNAGNLMWNLSNETYLKDPNASQMDPEVAQWEGIPKENGCLRDTLLFRRWAGEIMRAIREAGAKQPVAPGYMFSLVGGGDSYLANRDGDIAAWHSYVDLPGTALNLAYFDPICTGRPLIMEEFGTSIWNSREMYDTNAHLALAGGAAAAMSWEWGMGWLAREMCFYPLPLREAIDAPADPRWFAAVNGTKAWPERAAGIFPYTGAFSFGTFYGAAAFPNDAAVVLGRLGLISGGLGRAFRPEKVYLLVRAAKNDKMDAYYAVMRWLWRHKIAFGVWQEDCLGGLPAATRLLICPDGVTPGLEGKLDGIRKSGVAVFMGSDDGWKKSPELAPIAVEPGEEIDLLVRRTTKGTLYVLSSERPVSSATLTTEGQHAVALGLQKFGMVHEIEDGVRLIEAAGEVWIGGSRFCAIEKGRAIIAAEDGRSLQSCNHARVVVTEPTRIEFARPIQKVSVLEEGLAAPVAVLDPTALARGAVEIDEELTRYVLRLEFLPDLRSAEVLSTAHQFRNLAPRNIETY